MDARTKAALLKANEEIKKKQGNSALYTLFDKNAIKKINRVSTCIDDLDYILGGGLPTGRAIEIYGGESDGKTTLMLYLLSLFEMSYIIPAEGTFDEQRAFELGNTPDQLYVLDTTSGEDILNKTLKYSRLAAPVIAIDSVPFIIPKKEKIKRQEAADKNTVKQQQTATVAGLFSQYAPELNDAIELSGTTLIFINQLREKIGGMLPPGMSPPKYTMGGKFLKHLCSIRLEVARTGWINLPNKDVDPRNTASNIRIGFTQKVLAKKNKTAPPMYECELTHVFGHGYVAASEVKDLKPIVREELRKKYLDYKNGQDNTVSNEWDEWSEDWDG